jgi:hypothetical protein
MKIQAQMNLPFLKREEPLQIKFHEIQEQFRQKARIGAIPTNLQTTIRRLKSSILEMHPANRQNCPAGEILAQVRIRRIIMAEQSSQNRPGKIRIKAF